jgi:tetratricopeptide (TPR) repeat protein
MNIKKIIAVLIVSISFQTIVAQKDGYWDKERATKREIVVSARDRIIIKTEDLPVGTTEVVYRITLLDVNQQMANSLVSVLKSIPDPTGISQGSAGALFLLSKISGEDKCKYAIFSSEAYATDYKKTGVTAKACYDQNNPISQDAKGLSIDKSLCILPNANAMWFGFESKNWIMNQKIVLEVVPWVNTKLSSGWNLENRKLILGQCKSTDLVKKIIPADDFCVCVLEKLQKEYKFQEFQKLLLVEKSKAYADFGDACLKENGASDKTFSDLRTQATELVKQGKYSEAIDKIAVIVLYAKANAADFNRLGYAYMMTKQYSKAIKSLKDAEKIDEADLLIQMNLAHAYMLNDNFKMAKPIHKKYQSQNVTASLSWTQKVQQDFEVFIKAGLPTNDFDRVLRLLKD